MKKIFLTISTIIAVSFWSCSKDETTVTQPLTAKIASNLAANPTVSTSGQPIAATGKFKLFSFANGEIANSDSATTKWDVGFRSTTIIFNSGVSGLGKAGVIMKDGLFTDFTEAPTTGYVQDATGVYSITAGSGKGWYNYNATNNIISPIAGRVFIVKTADGKYAKFEVVSYYKDAPTTPNASSLARYYTIRYIYQPDGSTKLN